jgi:hypothetical protein
VPGPSPALFHIYVRLFRLPLNKIAPVYYRYPGRPALYHNRTDRNLNALPMTETELKLMAAAAIMGLSSKPKYG